MRKAGREKEPKIEEKTAQSKAGIIPTVQHALLEGGMRVLQTHARLALLGLSPASWDGGQEPQPVARPLG